MDLTTAAYVQSIVGASLSADQVAALPGMVTAASTAIETWCNRQFNLQLGISDILDPEETGRYILSTYPVVRVHRVGVDRSTALTITWTEPTVRRAPVELIPAIAGSVVAGSITLGTVARGATTTMTLPFASLPDQSLEGLAAAITDLPGSWLAEVGGGFELAGVEELVAGSGPLDALQGAECEAFAGDGDYTLDAIAGLIAIRDYSLDDPFRSDRFGPIGSEDDLWSPSTGQVRVDYDAGYAIIPADVQLAVAELVKADFERLSISSVLQSERTDTWSWTAREFGEVVGSMPVSVQRVVAKYGDHAR